MRQIQFIKEEGWKVSVYRKYRIKRLSKEPSNWQNGNKDVYDSKCLVIRKIWKRWICRENKNVNMEQRMQHKAIIDKMKMKTSQNLRLLWQPFDFCHILSPKFSTHWDSYTCYILKFDTGFGARLYVFSDFSELRLHYRIFSIRDYKSKDKKNHCFFN